MMRISPEHLGQTSGSVSQTLRIKWDQRLFSSLETTGGGSSAIPAGCSYNALVEGKNGSSIRKHLG
jgi:hypothetical protein